MRFLSITFLVKILFLTSCQLPSDTQIPFLSQHTIGIDGVPTDPDWSKGLTIKEFSNPWEPSMTPSTQVSMFTDASNFYFNFAAYDTTLVLADPFEGKGSVVKEDRVELFFSKDKDMKEYYCFEMDPKGRVLAYKATNYRKFDMTWAMPNGMTLAARQYDDAYVVEGVIPLSFLNELMTHNELYMGAYRAEFRKEGDKTIESWMTWVNPNTTKPDFHVPTSLKKVHFLKTPSKH